MTTATLYGLLAAALIGIGLFGAILHREFLRRIVAINVLGAGVFLLFGAVARRGAEAGVTSDPIPQAMVITGIVVAFAGTALAVAILMRLADHDDDANVDEPSEQPPAHAPTGGSGDPP